METSRVRGNELGAVSTTVGQNLGLIRQIRRMRQEDLSRRLREAGRPIPITSIGKMEIGLRRVDVDDLMALAEVLEVSPLALLIPLEASLPMPVADGDNPMRHEMAAMAMASTSVRAQTVPTGETRYLTLAQAAELLSCPEQTLRYWVQMGTAPASFKMGRRRMFDRSEIETWLEEKVTQSV